MKSEIALLQDFIDALDDTGTFNADAAPEVSRPCFKHLLTRVAQTHRRIADDLAASMAARGSSAARGGGLLQPLRRLRTAWQARISFDIELACAIRAEACEERLLRQSRDAMAGVADVELRHRRTRLTVHFKTRDVARICGSPRGSRRRARRASHPAPFPPVMCCLKRSFRCDPPTHVVPRTEPPPRARG